MAEQAWFCGEGGGRHLFDLPLAPPYADQVRQGRLVPIEAPDDTAATEASDAAPEVADDATPLAVDEAPEVRPKPGVHDLKAEWVAYAVEVGGLTEAQAEAMTKTALMERFAA